MITAPTSPFAQVLADLFQVFAAPEAQTKGIAFDRETTALWAEALHEMVCYARSLEAGYAGLAEQFRTQQLAKDLLDFARSGAPRSFPDASNVIDISEALERERTFRRQRTEGEPA